MTFGTSAYLEWRFSEAAAGAALPLIFPLASLLGASESEIESYSTKPFRNGELQELAVWTHRVVSVTKQNPAAENAKRFWAAQALAMPVLCREPLVPGPLDPVAARLLCVGADALYEAGALQFRTLHAVCRNLVDWLRTRGYVRIALIESPLGNCVPVAVLEALAKHSGIAVETITWNAPRNDRAALGRTVSHSVEPLAANVPADTLIVFVDDVITGSRFIKTVDALFKRFPARVLPIAMVFRDPTKQGGTHDQLTRVKARTEKAGRALGYAETCIEFPMIPAFLIDDDAPVLWESPVIWGETDLVAGKRKVNLIFNLLDHLWYTLDDLASPSSKLAQYLVKSWGQNTKGEAYSFAPEIREQVFSRLSAQLAESGFKARLTESARSSYPDDFTGELACVTQFGARERWDWLRDNFLAVAEKTLRAEEAYILWRAFDETFAASLHEIRPRPSRDHAYSAYALPYNSTIRSFHEHLVSRIVAETLAANNVS